MGELIAALVILLVPSVARCDVLTAVDLVRAHAWHTGDTELLSDLYVPGSGRDDVTHLRAWRDRGIAVRGARTVRASCRAVGTGVEVVERLGPMVAVMPDGTRRALPADDWDERRIGLVYEGRWRITAVT